MELGGGERRAAQRAPRLLAASCDGAGRGGVDLLLLQQQRGGARVRNLRCGLAVGRGRDDLDHLWCEWPGEEWCGGRGERECGGVDVNRESGGSADSDVHAGVNATLKEIGFCFKS